MTYITNNKNKIYLGFILLAILLIILLLKMSNKTVNNFPNVSVKMFDLYEKEPYNKDESEMNNYLDKFINYLEINNVNKDIINKELDSKEFKIYEVKVNFNENIFYKGKKQKNTNGSYFLNLYTINTENYIYVYDYKILNKFFSDEFINIHNIDIDINNLNVALKNNEDLTINFILNYSSKNKNSETQLLVFKHNIKLTDDL